MQLGVCMVVYECSSGSNIELPARQNLYASRWQEMALWFSPQWVWPPMYAPLTCIWPLIGEQLNQSFGSEVSSRALYVDFCNWLVLIVEQGGIWMNPISVFLDTQLICLILMESLLAVSLFQINLCLLCTPVQLWPRMSIHPSKVLENL